MVTERLWFAARHGTAWALGMSVFALPRIAIIVTGVCFLVVHYFYLDRTVRKAREYYREPLFRIKELHRPVESHDPRIAGTVCEECSDVSSGRFTFFPCPTVEAAHPLK